MKSVNLSIVIPVWNEGENITPLVERIHATLFPKKISYEVIFIDDHSQDNTSHNIKKLSKKFPLKLFLKKGVRGKAQSLYEGFDQAQGKILVMLDGDLQYPPEALPEMMKKIQKGADIVVANRVKTNTSRIRKFLSRGFRKFFGEVLFGIQADVQAGLKMFRKDVYTFLQFHPTSGWTFDLEFLHKATQAGYQVENVDILFEKRLHGKSKVSFFKTSLEIGINALSVKSRRSEPVHFPPSGKKSMKDAGVGFNRRKYITHSTLHHSHSAIQTFVPNQKIFIFVVLVITLLALISNPLTTIQIFIGLLSFVYFIDVLFNLMLVLKSLHSPQEVVSTDEEIALLKDKDLPVYSILCPLYKEAHVLEHFVNAVSQLDYPKEKLDVLLLLEKDDNATISAAKSMNLPSYIRIVVVPDSQPKTKPKACNYGLSQAKGEYLVIYDAEDIPDPLQLKKAILAFKKVGRTVLCLQAKLNYYNPHQNFLTRFFTAEYSLWFDVTLTGLQAANTSIPLGGTSNHFRTEDLKSLEGWDPFNVTEDADLGIRLFKKGYKTAIIDSVTLEEANSDAANWVRQRSRWIKGYMQTYLVHTRKRFGYHTSLLHTILFHLNIGGKIAFILINPILWLLTIAYFTLYAVVGPTIEALYPSYIFYMAAFSLIAGNFLFLYYYMIGCAKRDQWSLIKYIYFVPIYWLMISWAGFVAFYQLLLKPHYWEKTIHGLHLQKGLKDSIEQIVINPATAPLGVRLAYAVKSKVINFKTKKHLYISGLALISATMGANILNLLFNVYLGRKLSLENFGELSLFTSLLYITSIPLGAFSAAISHNIAYLYGKQSRSHAQGYLRYIFSKSIVYGVFLTLAWAIASPFLTKFFHIGSLSLMILFSPLWLISVTSSNFSGYLAGTLSFGKKGIILFSEASTRLLLALLLIRIGLSNWTFAAIIFSTSFSALVSWLLVRSKRVATIKDTDKKFNTAFFFTSIFTGVSLITFLTLDVVLVKHFLSPTEAGEYGLLSLIGKMTYFLGSLLGPFMIPLVSHNNGAKKDSKATFMFLFIVTTIFCLGSFLALGVFGRFFVPFIFGAKTIAILPLLAPYVLSIAVFTISQPIVNFFQAKENYSFAIVGLFVAALQITLTVLFHKDLTQIVWVMLTTSTLNFALMMLLYVWRRKVQILLENIKDVTGLFAERGNEKVSSYATVKRILIFNWRDTRHKWAGGAETYIQELAKRWVKEGNSVTIFCGNDRKHVRNEVIEGIEIFRRGGFYTVYFWAFLYYIFRFRGKYDVIIDSENGIPFFTPLYARIPVFLLIHHVHQEVFRKSLRPPFSWLASFLEGKAMPFVYRDTQVITVSPSSKEEILRHNLTKKEPIIIYNGVDLDSFKPGKKNKTPLVLYLGRLQFYKSINVFIKTAQKVLEQIPNATFVIAGEGEERSSLQRYVKSLGLEDKIQFTGKVSHEEKITLMQKAWVFLNPSFMEGWGITSIEANACGTPVVASNVPGLKDSINAPHTGILVPYGNVDEFAKETMSIIQDARVRKNMGNEAIQWANEFSWDESASKFLKTIYHVSPEKILGYTHALSVILTQGREQ